MKYVSAPSSTFATSRIRTCDPSGLTLSRMFSNSAGVCSNVASAMVAVSRCVVGAGVPPSWPPATWTFWFWIALLTSTGVRAKLLSLSVSSQIRIAYCVPNTLKFPTPLIRLSGSCRCETT